MKPYVYVSTSKVGARDITRQIPTDTGSHARVALHGLGDGSRSLEIWTDYRGIWSLESNPGPVHGGGRTTIARGCLPDAHRGVVSDEWPEGEQFSVTVGEHGAQMEIAEIRRRLAALEAIRNVIDDKRTIGRPSEDVDKIISILSELDGQTV